ncbi:gag-pol polyprotein [Tanacetum coccineum]
MDREGLFPIAEVSETIFEGFEIYSTVDAVRMMWKCGKAIDKLETRAVNVAGDRENVGTQVVQQSRIQCYNYKEYGHVARECQKQNV